MTTQKVAVITAGGTCMGAAAARRLAQDGYCIAILSPSGKGEALAVSLGGIGMTGSAASDGDLKRLIGLTMGAWGRIDVLVNSVGHGPGSPAPNGDDWSAGMFIYLQNAVRPTRIVTPIMQKQQSGSIINISAFSAVELDTVFAASGLFHAGLAAFTRLFAEKYAADNIRMNNVLPGFVDSAPEHRAFTERFPIQGYGEKEEIAAVVAMLTSEGGGGITGRNILLDFGISNSA